MIDAWWRDACECLYMALLFGVDRSRSGVFEPNAQGLRADWGGGMRFLSLCHDLRFLNAFSVRSGETASSELV